MSTNTTTGPAAMDDFDACCDSGYYRRHLAVYTPESTGATAYDAVRPAYAYGHRAATVPAYTGRTFEEVEPELRREYGEEESKFDQVRDYVRQGFEWKTVLGGLALAAGGWWAGKKVYEAVAEMTEEDEQDCRVYYEAHPARSAGLSYERARAGYTLGYTAGRNPDYQGRLFDDVEPQLRGAYVGSYAGQYGTVSDFARRGYERGSTR